MFLRAESALLFRSFLLGVKYVFSACEVSCIAACIWPCSRCRGKLTYRLYIGLSIFGSRISAVGLTLPVSYCRPRQPRPFSPACACVYVCTRKRMSFCGIIVGVGVQIRPTCWGVCSLTSVLSVLVWSCKLLRIRRWPRFKFDSRAKRGGQIGDLTVDYLPTHTR